MSLSRKSSPAKKSAGSARPGSAPKRTRRRGQGSAPVLAVYVTPQTVYGLLMRDGPDGYEIVRRCTRQRATGLTSAGLVSAQELAQQGAATPGTAPPEDFTLTFGEGRGVAANDLFLEGEFAGLGADDGTAGAGASNAAQARETRPIVLELKDIIEECRMGSKDAPQVSFVISQPDVRYVELRTAEETKAKPASTPRSVKGGTARPNIGPPEATVKRDKLVALLQEKIGPGFEEERVSFVPMTPREGAARYLAVMPEPHEPIAPSLELLREQNGMKNIRPQLISAEVPTLVGLTRFAFPSDPHENTAIVRVGVDDTLVCLLVGGQLHHTEHMRSVTTFDGPDTICSRVLLQQDVQGIGTVHNVIVLSEEREEELVQGFSAFYPEARVGLLREGLAEVGVGTARGVSGQRKALPALLVPAAGVGLRTLLRKDKASPFEEVDLLPKRLRKRARSLSLPKVGVAWHTLVVAVLVALTGLYFLSDYRNNEEEIANRERRLEAFPPEAALTADQLQFRIDSLQAEYVRITAALDALDQLLVGSDKWTRTLALTSRSAASTGAVWVESWSPSGDTELTLEGRALRRGEVVRFAQAVNGSIESVTYDELREQPIFSYSMRLALPNELPEVARYLRLQAEGLPPDAEAQRAAEPLSSLDAGR